MPDMSSDDRPIPQRMPIVGVCEAGEYSWCACGRSANQPYCDGSHKNSGYLPMRVVVKSGFRAVACLAVLGVVALALLPPEHVHLGADHDDHVRPETVHRHFAPHHPIAIQTHVEPPDDEATYLDNAFAPLPQFAGPGPQQPSYAVLPEIPVTRRVTTWHPKSRDLRAHDPPWADAPSLRGPPSLS